MRLHAHGLVRGHPHLGYRRDEPGIFNTTVKFFQSGPGVGWNDRGGGEIPR